MSNPWDIAELLLDKNKRPIPQLWDDVNQKFVPYTPTIASSGSGSNSGGSTSGTVTTNTYVAKEPFSGSSTVTHTFNESMNGLVISNDGASDLTFTIGTDTYTVKAGEVFEDLFQSFTTVTINTTVAFRAYGKMSVTPIATVTTPADVTNLTTSGLTDTTVTLSWTASTGATSYDIYNGSTLLTNVTTTSYNVTGLTASTQYTFKVVAKNSAGSSAGVTTTVTTNAPAVTIPNDVTNLAVGTISSGTVALSWTASSGATSYDVYQGSTLLGNTTSTSYTASGLSASTAYTFKVVAKNSAGSSAGVTVNATTSAPPQTAPNDVTNLATSNVTYNSLTVGWTASSGATSYDVYQGATLLGNTANTSYPVTGLSASTSYTFKVIAKNSAGSSTGVTTTVTTAVAPPADVTNLAASSITQTSLTLGWTASANATSYDVYNGATLLGNVTTTSYNVTGLTAGTAYTFKVIAKNASGSSTGVTVNATTTVAAPADVTNLATSSVTQTTLSLGWTASATATSYDVYNGATLLGNTTSTSYNVTGLTAGTAYTFKVVAKNAGGSSAGATVNVTTTSADTTPPTVTISPAAGTFTSTQTVTLSGTDNSGGAVTIYYTTDGTTPTSSSTVYSSPITVSATETIKYFGVDPSGNQSTVQTATYTINPPAIGAVSALTVGSKTDTTIPLTWTAPTYGTVANYEIAYSTDGTNFTVANAGITVTATSYTITGLSGGTLYTVRVVAIDGSGNRSNPTTTQAKTLTVVVHDSFNRANSTGLGTADSGQTWTALSETWNVSSNQAVPGTNTSGVNNAGVAIDSGVSDCTIKVKATGTSLGSGASAHRIAFRVASTTSYLLLQLNNSSGGATLYSCNNGFTSIANNPTYTPTLGTVYTIVLSGSNITIMAGSTTIITATSTYNQTSTMHGLTCGDATQATTIAFDDYYVLAQI